MALIFCPECANEISDKSNACIHCGCPIKKSNDIEPSEQYYNICPKCGRLNVKTICPDCSTKMVNTLYSRNFKITDSSIRKKWDKKRAWKQYLREKYVIGSPEFDEQLYNKRIAEETAYNQSMDKSLAEAAAREASMPKCPTCGSTNVQKISLASKAAGGFFFGLFSSNVRNTYKCNQCGYKW